MNIHNKSDAITLFGSAAALARAIGVTKSAIGQWNEELTQRQIDEVVGAGIRLKLIDPGELEKTA